MDYMILPLKRYAEFSGRSRRKEYWMFTLLMAIVYVFLALADERAILSGLVYLALLVPSIAVGVRRLHDQDKSGWLMLLGLIPILGGLILLVFMCIDGTPGPNRFGPDPKSNDPENLAATFS